jgi:CSLREA domain-containing protein
MHLRTRLWHLAALASLLAAMVGGPLPAVAAPAAVTLTSFVVDTLGDSNDLDLGDPACADLIGDCSLRAALQQANASAGADIITFSVTGNLVFTGPSPIITDSVSLIGPSAAALTVMGDGSSSVLPFSGGPANSYRVEGMTISGGEATLGGGIQLAGLATLVISGTVITGNWADIGGGLSVAGPTQLINSAVLTNTATVRGGGVSSTGKLEIINSRIAANQVVNPVFASEAAPQGTALTSAGGGIYSSGTLTLTASLVEDNSVEVPSACASLQEPSGVCASDSGPAGFGGGPYGGGLALELAHALVRGSTLAGNHFTAYCGACPASPTGVILGQGGGVYNGAGVLVMSDSTLDDNTAYYGGGLVNISGDVLLVRTQVVDNTASRSAGGVHSEGGPLVVQNSQIVDNNANDGPAGGLQFWSGALVIQGSEFAYNQARLGGGGLSIFDALVTIDDTRVHHNDAGYFPVSQQGALEPQVAVGSEGGGLLLSASGTVIRQSAIYSNTADLGGGLANSGMLTMTNVTVSNNSARASGGGLLISLPPASVAGGLPPIRAALRHVTLAGNIADSDNNTLGDGGGVYAVAGYTITFSSSIVALNIDLGGEEPGCAGPGGIVSAGYNLWTTLNDCGVTPAAGDQFNVTDALVGLQGLQNNGGPTPTRGLNFGSPALDAANPVGCPSVDQRGVARPFGAGCDVGAFELAGLYLPFVWR